MLLAVDTSGATSVAVVEEDGSVVRAASSDDPRGHAESIGPLLAEVLHGLDRAAITGVAVGVGPGPYTGLRVGMAAARAAALALGVPELPVLSHDALALAALEAGTGLPLVVVAVAKRRERFATVYRELDGAALPRRAGEPAVGADVVPEALPRAEGAVDAALLGRIAALRRTADVPLEPAEARYLRSPDVTLSTPKRVGS
ncbi:tRNA (adenosine(37)-N6)-threonylcarbamoyltransferase complex dimerization subunit type 1 TsaB [Amnibacterium endophyticum]|uniref:tRNA (Adenosine(37)-N6)-threonylcarbamoyltransferase complex dimerization subunit type 1 TsaB n=1 Tax=Amnibacterium endophyticum TaxID=2109337 RepID=A0ABW4LC52_9MICO